MVYLMGKPIILKIQVLLIGAFYEFGMRRMSIPSAQLTVDLNIFCLTAQKATRRKAEF